jgi:hypothetical protein
VISLITYVIEVAMMISHNRKPFSPTSQRPINSLELLEEQKVCGTDTDIDVSNRLASNLEQDIQPSV